MGFRSLRLMLLGVGSKYTEISAPDWLSIQPCLVCEDQPCRVTMPAETWSDSLPM